jgi:hypothetical protein
MVSENDAVLRTDTSGQQYCAFQFIPYRSTG